MQSRLTLSALLIAASLMLACNNDDTPKAADDTTPPKDTPKPADKPGQAASTDDAGAREASKRFGLSEGYSVSVAFDGGLNNPSDISFSPAGTPTIADSGNGRVLLVEDGKLVEAITGFDTEFWKGNPDAFKVGPLSAVWVDEETLAVTDGGKKDGQETVNLYYMKDGKFGDGNAYSDDASKIFSNPVSTDHNAGWTNEGNLCGMCADDLGANIYVCGQGSDDKTLVLHMDVASFEMKPLLSADEHDIAINSPMETLITSEGNLLVLYSGAGGVADGLMVLWDLETLKPIAQYDLGKHGINDPMSMALVQGTDATYAVVDNNWALDKVQPGTLSLVTLKADSMVEVETIATKLEGPVACAFDQGGDLWITQLGSMFDQNKGNVIVVSGISE